MSETRSTAAPTSRYDRKSTLAGVVLGNYRLISEISSGGMGTVYRAQHEILGRPAAVKLLKRELIANEEMVERFLIEAKASTKIRHPGIVEIYDFGYSEDGIAYLAMELLEGKPLGKALEQVERYAEWEAANIARGIASALKAAHSQGIIHRDLKPDNIFLVPDLEGVTGALRPKVLDFGIAKLSAEHRSHHTMTGVLMGTPLYMAPEQARQASAIDHRADLYSLGCILYELLCGKPPFTSDASGELIALHMFSEPEPLTARVQGISPEMNALVLRLLAKDPRDRPQSAGEVATALGTLGARMSHELAAISPSGMMASSPVRVQPTNTGHPVLDREAPTVVPGRRSSSMPIIAGVVTVLVAAGIIVGVVAMRSGRGDDEPREQPKPPPETKQPEVKPAPPPPPKPDPVTAKQTDDMPLEPDPTRPAPDPKPTPAKPNPPPPVVTAPDPKRTPAPTPKGPVTDHGSPIETDLGPVKKKDPK